MVEVNEPDLQTVEVVTSIHKSQLQAIDGSGSIVDTDLQTANSRMFGHIDKGELNAIDCRLSVVLVYDAGQLNSRDGRLICIEISKASRLHAYRIGCLVSEVESASDGKAGEVTICDIADPTDINSVNVAVPPPKSTHSDPGDREVRRWKLYGRRNSE